MFCPECGTEIEVEVDPSLEEVVRGLKAMSTSRQDMATDVLVGNIVSTMEKKAVAEGQCTYYTGTFAVAPCTLATAGLTCEREPNWHGNPPSLRWTAFFGDDWEHLTRKEAIQHLLAERS